MQRPALASWLFNASVAVFLIGLAISLPAFDVGIRIAGAALLALALWLFRYDIAGRTVREHGLPRYMAVSLLCGYFWLAAAGMLWITFADDFVAGPKYDAMLHAVFLGFVFSMIFAHAPVIFLQSSGERCRSVEVFIFISRCCTDRCCSGSAAIWCRQRRVSNGAELETSRQCSCFCSTISAR
jgi:hypothetical protein